ncbi:MAG: hypothetical protein QOF62_1812 [Pyrinomonadaceae bacterium]|nr:hypothetical protein [Pyrinomonadaceae bacterium]
MSLTASIIFLVGLQDEFRDAHKYLEKARRLSVSTKNKVQTAVIDENTAQVLVAEGKLKDAEAIARHAVRVLDKTGHQGF